MGGQINDDVSATFSLVDGVELYGGFAATETIRTQRDWLNNKTVLSGDVDNNDDTGPYGITHRYYNIDGSNSHHVVTSNGNDATLLLDGFYITAGDAVGYETGASYLGKDLVGACIM